MESGTKTAIITAVLTGVFTAVAGVATYWLTTKEPELAYSVVGGPTLAGASGTKRIFVVEVRNSGRKEISQTLVQLAISSGELSEIATEASPGVKLLEEKLPKQVDIRADLLNPGDSVKVSLLAAQMPAGTEPRVVVRAPGVQAVADSPTKTNLASLEKSSIWVLLVSASAAVGSSLFLRLGSTRLTRKLVSAMPDKGLGQCEIVAFVCSTCGLHEEADRIRFSGGKVSYRGSADFLKHRALLADNEKRVRYRVALEALLLTKINPKSEEVLRNSIDAISGTKLSDTQFSVLTSEVIFEGEKPEAWRAAVEGYVKKNLTDA